MPHCHKHPYPFRPLALQVEPIGRGPKPVCLFFFSKKDKGRHKAIVVFFLPRQRILQSSCFPSNLWRESALHIGRVWSCASSKLCGDGCLLRAACWICFVSSPPGQASAVGAQRAALLLAVSCKQEPRFCDLLVDKSRKRKD